MEFPWGQVTWVQRDDGTWWETEGAQGRQDGTRARDWGGSGRDEIKPYGKRQKSISDSQIPLHAFWLLFLIWSETSPDLTQLACEPMQQIKAQSRVGSRLGFLGKVRGQQEWKWARGLTPALGGHLSTGQRGWVGPVHHDGKAAPRGPEWDSQEGRAP